MKKILLLFVLTSQLGFAQFNQQRVWNFQDAMARDPAKEIIAQGSPFIQDEFSPVRLNKFKDKVFNARYNAYHQEMHIETSEKTIALDVNDDYTVTFLGSNKVYKTVDYTDKNSDEKRGFLVVVTETNDYSLYKKEEIIFQDLVPAKTSYDKEKPAKYKRLDDKYYIKLSNKVSYFSVRKKDIINSFPKNSKAIKSFIKENKISLNEDKDIAKLAGFLATL
ncbi:hypothetical protein DFQ05_1325 [Winogradskyella wandonensis]|uniref:Uncharacterized protein n=1 Tax=Winogradskyella wandonensis TaxID=1442586 RepID=A0A4R1KSH4_9FLAO|nr:hypothetical protein [Winogradskyella wandonensis]TCK67547.1 hypothetical protein DFQ05_1325 [Winogradskyella wandonensis]